MRIFVFAFVFPPLSSAGYKRPLRFVDYLTKKGHEVTVFSGSSASPFISSYYPIDKQLTLRIPSSVRVIRSCSIHGFKVIIRLRDTLRGFRGKRNPTTSGSSQQTPKAVPAGSTQSGQSAQKSKIDTIMDLFSIPDPMIGWILTAFPRALLHAFLKNPDIIYVTGPPWTPMILARAVAKVTKTPLCLDYRDPWSANTYFGNENRVSARLEQWVQKGASASIFNTETMQRNYESIYPDRKDCFCSIYNGFDTEVRNRIESIRREKERESKSAKGKFTIAHIGLLHPNRMPPTVAQRLAEVSADWAKETPLSFTFVGTVLDRSSLSAPFQQLGTLEKLELTGTVSQEEALVHSVSCDVLLLLQFRTKQQIPIKLFEYVFAGKPILFFAEPESEVAALAKKYKLGPLFYEDTSAADLRGALEDLYDNRHVPVVAPKDFLEHFDGNHLASRMEEVLLGCHSSVSSGQVGAT